MNYLIAEVECQNNIIKLFKDKKNDRKINYIVENPAGVVIDSCYGYIIDDYTINKNMLNNIIDDIQLDNKKYLKNKLIDDINMKGYRLL